MLPRRVFDIRRFGQRLLIEARVEAATAKIRYRQALASLYRTEGTLLDRRGIRVEEPGPPP